MQLKSRLLLAFASIWGLDADIVERTLSLSKPAIQVRVLIEQFKHTETLSLLLGLHFSARSQLFFAYPIN